MDKESSINFADPFTHPNFTFQDIPQQHRRAVSSPMKILPVPTRESSQQSYINQLPMAVSAFDLASSSQRHHSYTREVASPQPILRRPPEDISNATFITACNDPI